MENEKQFVVKAEDDALTDAAERLDLPAFDEVDTGYRGVEK